MLHMDLASSARPMLELAAPSSSEAGACSVVDGAGGVPFIALIFDIIEALSTRTYHREKVNGEEALMPAQAAPT